MLFLPWPSLSLLDDASLVNKLEQKTETQCIYCAEKKRKRQRWNMVYSLFSLNNFKQISMDSFISIVSRRLATSPIPSGTNDVCWTFRANKKTYPTWLYVWSRAGGVWRKKFREDRFLWEAPSFKKRFLAAVHGFCCRTDLNKPVMAMLHKGHTWCKKYQWWLMTDHWSLACR